MNRVVPRLLALALIGTTTASLPVPPVASQSLPTVAANVASPPPAAATTRLMAQQGLAIALASNVLQNQLEIIRAAVSRVAGCSKLTGGGSSDSSDQGKASETSAAVTVRIFYDNACKSLYMSSRASTVLGTSVASVKAVTLFQGLDGHDLGTLTTSATATGAAGVTDLVGTGTFVFARKGVPVAHLGLACAVPSAVSNGTVKPFPCTGAVAQYFAALGESLGSVSPLVLSLSGSSTNPSKVSFSGASSLMAVGPKDLSVGAGPHGTLVLTGGARRVGSERTSGHAGGFAIFPPTPTGWTGTNKAAGQVFKIAVTDNTTRRLQGSVTTLATGQQLAVIALDRSGTGTIRYSGSSRSVAVAGWVLEG
jgi:hypothetical protein